jgi:hypothetical protein
MADYGTDFAGVEDLDAGLSVVSGGTGLMQAVSRRWITSAGELFYAPDYGEDLHQWIGANVITGRIEARLEAEALKDERVKSCSVSVEYVPEEKLFRVKAAVTGKNSDSYRLTLDVSEVTVALLTENA